MRFISALSFAAAFAGGALLGNAAPSAAQNGLSDFFTPIAAAATNGMSVQEARVENLESPGGIATGTPRFSWKVVSTNSGDHQTAYQIQVASTPFSPQADGQAAVADLWDSGKVAGDASVLVPYGGKPLTSRQIAYWRVRAWDKEGKLHSSRTGKFSVGLLGEGDWQGEYISAPAKTGKNAQNPSSIILRKKFTLPVRAVTCENIVLHINSLGYHEVYVNGVRISDEVLSPAVSQFTKRSQTRAFLIPRELLKDGENEIVLWLGSGWYKTSIPGVVYPLPVARAQLEASDGKKWTTLLKTDASWEFANGAYNDTGRWTWNGFGGEVLDARKRPAEFKNKKSGSHHCDVSMLEHKPAVVVKIPAHQATPQMSEGNRVVKSMSLAPKEITAAGENAWLVDFGATLTGWFSCEFPKLDEGQTITLEYSDHLNRGRIAGQGQVDRYIAAGKGIERFSNKFNYHCFRYVKISNLKQKPDAAKMRADFISTDFKNASSFECSDKDLNGIHDMVKRTLHALSLGGYLVDCTHIERCGYGGDGHASTKTFQIMFDVAPLYRNWMQAWNDVQFPDGRLPYTAPSPQEHGGGPYWCAFVVQAPWSAYVQYGDKKFLEDYYPNMQKWLGYTERFTKDGIMRKWNDPRWRRLWYLGDWAYPAGVDGSAIDLVCNCVMADVFTTMEKTATVLNKPDDAKKYAALAKERREKIHEHFFNKQNNTYGKASQIDIVYPLLVGAVPVELRGAVEAQLEKLVAERDKGHLKTGLVGVPVITEWATRERKTEFLYKMLKTRGAPGYLHMLDSGADTTWEHWNGSRSRLHNCFNGIGAWFYEGVGGLRADESAPGYKKFFVDPQPPSGVTWAKVSKQTPYGEIRLEWERVAGNSIVIKLTVPFGTTAQVPFRDPDTGKTVIKEYPAGSHRIER
ncbi:MAG: glycoside hydrolase family 78 protein [Puniceicoccales bacterium]|jgi:alpha-L-rhamnosidase|nr:glycoside hydrolase family 78 protein [Puniceicoccales bacterium]